VFFVQGVQVVGPVARKPVADVPDFGDCGELGTGVSAEGVEVEAVDAEGENIGCELWTVELVDVVLQF
jgi:hypothetical protein